MDSSNSLIWQTVSNLLWTSNSPDKKPEEITYDGNITSLALEDALGGPLGTLGTFRLRQHLYRCCVKKSKIEAALLQSTVFYPHIALENVLWAVVEVILQIIRLPHEISASSFSTPLSGQSQQSNTSSSSIKTEISGTHKGKSFFEIDAVLLMEWILEIFRCNKSRIPQLWKPVQGMLLNYVLKLLIVLGLINQMMFELNANYLCLKYPFVLERVILFILSSCFLHLTTIVDVSSDNSIWESVRLLKTIPFPIIEQVSASIALSVQGLIK